MNIMKTGASSLLLAALALTTMAQDARLKNDVTYSPNNYKHANKAALAKQWEHKAGVAVQTPDRHQTDRDDYKQQPMGTTYGGGITISVQASAMPEQNYKTQHWLRPGETQKHTTSGPVI